MRLFRGKSARVAKAAALVADNLCAMRTNVRIVDR
jgi:hypothetical protein